MRGTSQEESHEKCKSAKVVVQSRIYNHVDLEERTVFLAESSAISVAHRVYHINLRKELRFNETYLMHVCLKSVTTVYLSSCL